MVAWAMQRTGRPPATLESTQYGEWTVIGTPKRERGGPHYRVKCRCSCGCVANIPTTRLRAGRSRSCLSCAGARVGSTVGRLNLEAARRKHGEATVAGKTPEYRAWQNLHGRCGERQPYGRRGIRVCPRWESFENFLADVGRRPSAAHSIDRIDGTKGYEPSNCRWATSKQQGRNTTRNRLLTALGATRCTAEWAEILKVPPYLVTWRLRHGWTVEQALFTPKGGRRA